MEVVVIKPIHIDCENQDPECMYFLLFDDNHECIYYLLKHNGK